MPPSHIRGRLPYAGGEDPDAGWWLLLAAVIRQAQRDRDGWIQQRTSAKQAARVRRDAERFLRWCEETFM